MTAILNQAITTAAAGQLGPVLQLRDGPCESMLVQSNFVYGSGGTSVTAYVQTSLDGGTTWCDVANFALTTTSLRSVINLSALTAITTPTTPTDGALASNTTIAGVIGSLWRVKYTSVGTYAGNTNLRVDLQPNRGKLTSLT